MMVLSYWLAFGLLVMLLGRVVYLQEALQTAIRERDSNAKEFWRLTEMLSNREHSLTVTAENLEDSRAEVDRLTEQCQALQDENNFRVAVLEEIVGSARDGIHHADSMTEAEFDVIFDEGMEDDDE